MQIMEYAPIIIIVVILVMFFGPTIKALLEYLKGRPRKVRIETMDIIGEVKKGRLRIAKAQKPRDMRRLVFLGDEDCHSLSLGKIKGYIPDTRCTEFFIKLKWYRITPIWVLIPSELVENLVGGDCFVNARGLKNLGVFYVPVMNVSKAPSETKYAMVVQDYLQNLLRLEGVTHLAQERVNAFIAASSPQIVREQWVHVGSMGSSDNEEEEELD